FAGVEGQFTVSVWPIKAIIVLGALVAALECSRQLAAPRLGAASAGKGASGIAWFALLGPLAIVVAVLLLWLLGAGQRTIGVSMIAALLVLIALGMPIAISLLLTGFVGLALLKHDFGVATKVL